MARIDNQKTEYIRKGQPHFQHIGATFSVTIIAHDAIPKQVLEKLNFRRQVVLREIEMDSLPKKRERKEAIQKKYYGHVERLLHAKMEQEHPFKNPVAAKCIADRIEKYAGKYYDLLAYSVMSNHAHMMFDFSIQCPDRWNGVDEVPDYVNLAEVLRNIKGGSAFDLNKKIGRKGRLWKPGYYDRYMRNAEHLTTEFWYIVRNAKSAGIVDDWRDHPFTFGTPDLTGFADFSPLIEGAD